MSALAETAPAVDQRAPIEACVRERATRWAPAPAQPLLTYGAVHVWRADLATVGDELAGLLSAAERERAARFVSGRNQRRWTRSRSVLRSLLGLYLQADPARLRLTIGAHGKPALAGREQLSFNLSHSGDLALYAFAARSAVGVDVELERHLLDEPALAARAFGETEAQPLRALAPSVRRREFLRLWTRHEAALKCLGTGIGARRERAYEPADGLWTAELDVGPRAAAALALERPVGELRCWEWV